MTARFSLSFGKTGGHRPPLQKIEERKNKHPDDIDKVPVEAGDLSARIAIADNATTPDSTCSPWNPVITKKLDPNCG
jgi:hypothetical protein